MRKFFSFCLYGAVAAFLAAPASAEVWNIDFDNGVDELGNDITFDSNTIFSAPGGWNGRWQRYDAGTAGTSTKNPADGGIPNSNVNVKIDVWNGGRRDIYGNRVYGGSKGYAVGFDSSLSGTRDRDLEDPFIPQQNGIASSGYRNILIIQSHEDYYTRKCGGGLYGSGVCSEADDEGKGGDIVFEFDQEVTLFKMNIFDIEESGGKVKFADADGNWIHTVDIPSMDNNGVGLLTFNGEEGFKAHKMMVWLAGSGGIDNIMGDSPTTTTNVPEPATLGLFGLGLVAMGLYRRRRIHGA